MSTPNQPERPHYYVPSTAHPVVGGPGADLTHDEAIAALGALDAAYAQPPAAPQGDTADVIERARQIIADHCFGPHTTPAAEERALDIASACTDDMADQGLLAVAASPAAPQPTQAAGDRPRFWWSPSQALIRGGSRDTVPADAVELVPRTALLSAPVPADDEAALVPDFDALTKAVRSWAHAHGREYDTVVKALGRVSTSRNSVLATLKEGQR